MNEEEKENKLDDNSDAEGYVFDAENFYKDLERMQKEIKHLLESNANDNRYHN